MKQTILLLNSILILLFLCSSAIAQPAPITNCFPCDTTKKPAFPGYILAPVPKGAVLYSSGATTWTPKYPPDTVAVIMLVSDTSKCIEPVHPPDPDGIFFLTCERYYVFKENRLAMAGYLVQGRGYEIVEHHWLFGQDNTQHVAWLDSDKKPLHLFVWLRTRL